MMEPFKHKIHNDMVKFMPPCRKGFSALFATFIFLIQTIVLCTSCQQDEWKREQQKGLPAIVYLEIKGEEEIDRMTRTLNDATISDLHILIYDSDGKLIGQKYTTGSGTAVVNTRSADNCTIYAIANTGSANLFSNFSIHSENYLKEMSRSISSWSELTNGSTLPMTGSKPNVNITAGTNNLSGTNALKVGRMAAKITLNVSVAAGYGITIDGYRIYGIPQKSYYILRPLNTESTQNDTQTTRALDVVKPANTSDWTNSGKLPPTSSTSINTTFYMFENRPGINSSITSQENKVKTRVPGSPADSATYIIIYGKSTEYKSLSWKVYLGANNTSNFNIKRNCAYQYNITLKPTTNDTRVTYNKVIWAGSNIYWNGSKLTFDETVVNTGANSDLKQGVYFRWGSLIGMPANGDPCPTIFYIPTYNASSPTSSTWSYKTLTSSIFCFDNMDLVSYDTSQIDLYMGDTYLNDAARNTDTFYQTNKGDICQYLSKTGAVSGNWRMPTAQEFREEINYTTTGSYGKVTSTAIDGTTTINSYKTYTFPYGNTRFPASGARNAGGELGNRGVIGFYWTSSAYCGLTQSLDINFTLTYVHVRSTMERKQAFTIRCVRDQ